MPLFDSLYNFARWLAQNQNEAEDLVQETYLKALRSFASFKPDTNFRAWIFRILKNTFLGSCSKLERRMTLAVDSEEDLRATTATPESLLIGRADIDAVRRALQQLPIMFREVILLCDVEEASYREIAGILSFRWGPYVTTGQSPEDGSRVTRRSWCPPTRRLVSSGTLFKEQNLPKREPDWRIAESEKYGFSRSQIMDVSSTPGW